MSRLKIAAFAWIAGMALLTAGTDQSTARQNSALSLFPKTTEGIHVFNDQIDVQNLSDAQAEFAATHYAGAQKITLSGTRRLRAYNPDFVVLHYRLGIGLGYRSPDDQCQPNGDYLTIIYGDDWVQEWPGDNAVQEDWFYHYDGQRVYWCAWGWMLADTDNPGWRAWWMAQIKDQLAANESTGLFADSVTVPNYMGSDNWRPVLPDFDAAFEADWSRRLDDWMTWARGEFNGQYALIVNAGAMVTTRDATDYRLADGVMVEGFSEWGEASRFEGGDWRLQMDRVLALVNQDRVVILQNYIADPAERLWVLANYLLVKGDHTYINLETSQDAEWFPEYDLLIGHPVSSAAVSVQELQNSSGLYARPYSGGLILINPDPSGAAITLSLENPMFLVTSTTGGGDIPEDVNLAGWGVQTAQVSTVTVEPGQAAILLNTVPPGTSGLPLSTANDPTPLPAQPETAGSATLAAQHRSGQTFLTWKEIPDAPTMTYRIYRDTAPLDTANLSNVKPIAEVPQGSGIFWTERARALEPPADDQGYVSLRNYVISDLGPQLEDGMGLLVWTTHENGTFYYAVVAANGSLIGTAGPITEQVGTPQPVLAWQSANGLSRVYTQFIDYAAYNPTFDAPRQGNSFLGLPEWETIEGMAPQQQYAYNYWVGLPTADTCGGAVPDQVPLILRIEGWGGRYGAPEAAPYWCAVMIWGDDPNQSWYYGFSATHDYRTDAPVTTGPIVNYTEERLLGAIHDVIASLDAPRIDENRVYVYGHSMGGTGSLMLGERYPQIFAAASASEPMMNFAAAAMWVDELESKWGARSLNLPVENRGPDAAPLARYNGTGVWDWQNLGAQLAMRRGDDMGFISIAHGTQDTTIDWQTVAQPAYANFYTGNRAFIGEIIEADHTWLGFRDHPDWMFDALNFRRDESLPALSNASGSLAVPPSGVGGYNLTLEWSSSGNDFAGPPVDTPEEWSVVLRSQAGDQTADITPRRLQQFTLQAGLNYIWQNTRLGDGTVIQSGTVVADADGLVTIKGFAVGQDANRLTLRPQ